MPSSLIIGAGLAGLTAARELTRHGWDVTVVDKGRGIGGRLATRRIEQARLDHGAQYISAKTTAFKQLLQDLSAQDIVTEWHLEQATLGDTDFDHPRYIGANGMNEIAKALARNLTVLTNETVCQIRTDNTGWIVETEAGAHYRADSLIVTIPAPQALTLIGKSPVALTASNQQALSAITYHPCIAVMVVMNRPSLLPPPGAVRYQTGAVAWIADNGQKGISPDQPSVTIHASADFSQAQFDSDLSSIGQQLIDQVSEWIPASAVHSVQVHRWRYSLANQRYPGSFLAAEVPLPLLFGGDGFGDGNVEGAFTSGLEMATYLRENA